jgi:hypothetical protein
MAAEFCTGCGRRRGADDRFCAGCGRPFIATPEATGAALGGDGAVVPPPPTTAPTPAPAEASRPARAPRLRWPWLLVAGGLFVASLYTARGCVTDQGVEATGTVRVASGGGGRDAAAPVGTPSPSAVARPTNPPPTATAAPPATVQGEVAPVGQRPASAATATPAAVFYRGAPYGPVKIEAGQTQPVRLSLPQDTLVRATITITFNNRLSSLSGVPDLDVAVVGPQGALGSYPQVRNGFQLAFQASTAGDYTIVLSNARSRVNAKQVAIQFLQP